MEIQALPAKFEWDKHNIEHIHKHKVETVECEQVFFNIPFLIQSDVVHSKAEIRYFTLGKTNSNRMLVIIFTIRNKKIRVITARDVNRKERRDYETKKDSPF